MRQVQVCLLCGEVQWVVQGSREGEVERVHQQKNECPGTVVFKLLTGDTWTSPRSFQDVCVVKTSSIIIQDFVFFTLILCMNVQWNFPEATWSVVTSLF